MLIKLARPPKQTDLLTLAREMREHGRNAIWVASDLLRGREGRDVVLQSPIVNPLGLHARAAAKFVHAASALQRRIRVARGGREMDGKSIMGLLLLAAAQGTRHHDHGRRPDEADAIAALCALVERGFDEVAPCA